MVTKIKASLTTFTSGLRIGHVITSDPVFTDFPTLLDLPGTLASNAPQRNDAWGEV